MGAQKLLLPWRQGKVIDAPLAAWQGSGVAGFIVVAAAADEELVAHCRHAGAVVAVLPERPPDMKASVRAGLDEIARRFAPTADDVWLLAPADLPRLTARAIDQVIECGRAHRGEIVVACAGERRGHPVLFPWPLAGEVARLARDEGVNRLLDRREVVTCQCADEGILADIDTPEEYRREVDRGASTPTRSETDPPAGE